MPKVQAKEMGMSEWLLDQKEYREIDVTMPGGTNAPGNVAQAQLRKVVKRLKKAMDEDYEIFGFDYKLWQSLRKEAGLE